MKKMYPRLTPKSNLRHHCDKCEFATGDYNEIIQHGGEHEKVVGIVGEADKKMEQSGSVRTIPRTATGNALVERLRRRYSK